MLKQSPNRNQRSEGFKVKHAVKMFVALTVCFWILERVKQSCDERASQEKNSTPLASSKRINGEKILNLGRRGLDPHPGDEQAELEKDEDEELKSVDEERKPLDNEGSEGSAEEDETDSSDQDKTEEGEHEQLEDLIDEELTEAKYVQSVN